MALQLPGASDTSGPQQQQCQGQVVQPSCMMGKTLPPSDTLSSEQAGPSLCPCHYVGHT